MRNRHLFASQRVNRKEVVSMCLSCWDEECDEDEINWIQCGNDVY